MKWIDSSRIRVFFRAWDVEVDYYGFLPTPNDDCLYRLVLRSVEFLMRQVRRHIYKVPGTGFSLELQPISPTKLSTTPNDIDYGFQFSVMVRTCLGIGVHYDRAGPKFLRTYPRV